MRFETIRYMEWAKTHFSEQPEKRLNFAASGLPPLVSDLKELGIDPSKIPLFGENSYGYAKAEKGIANRYGVSPDHVMYTQGSSQANFLLVAVLTEPGDTLLVERPVYECLVGPAKSLGLNVRFLDRDKDEGWALSVEEAVQEFKHAKIALVSNPHNPGGTITDDDTLLTIAESLEDDQYLIVDEVYREWIEGEEAKTIGGKHPNVIATSSLTKVWGFGDLRCGWAIAHPEILHRARRANDHIGVINPFVSDWIAGELLSDPGVLNSLRAKAIDHVEKSRKQVVEFLNKEPGNRFSPVAPVQGGFGFWELEGWPGVKLARALEEEADVITVPGSFFFAPGGIRVGWTISPEVTTKVLANLAKWLERNKKANDDF